MPTESLTTVRPAGGGTYTSLDAWIVGEAANLVTGDTIAVAECYGGGNLVNSGNVDFGPFTTDATRYVELRVPEAEAHQGSWDTNKAYALTSGAFQSTISNGAEYMRIGALQVDYTGSFGSHGAIRAFTNEVQCDRTFLRCSDDTITTQAYTVSALSNGKVILRNCAVVNNRSTSASHQACVNATAGGTTNVEVYNCAVAGTDATGPLSSAALQVSGGTTGLHLTSQNCYIKASAANREYWSHNNDVTHFSRGSKDATASTSATDVSLQNIAYATSTFTSVTVGSEDFVLASGSPLLEVGADTSANGVTVDMIGVSRPQAAAYDIGPFETVLIIPSIFELAASLDLLIDMDSAITELEEAATATAVLIDIDVELTLE